MTQDEFIEYLIDILVHPDKFRIDKDGDQFFYKENKLYFEYSLKNDRLWCSYKHVWNVLNKKYGLNHKEIKDLLKDMLLKHFNMSGTTPTRW